MSLWMRDDRLTESGRQRDAGVITRNPDGKPSELSAGHTILSR